MNSWQRLADLPVAIDGYRLERLDSPLGGDRTRSTTIVSLGGDGHEGLGEDVTYSPEDHDALHAAAADLPLAGGWTLASLADHIAALDLFPLAPHDEVYRRYRRWAFESAALDLALRQGNTSLYAALELTPAPVRFVASLRLADPPTLDPIERRLAQHPDLKFKLDPTPDWDAELIGAIAALQAVAICDLKGHYGGTVVDNPADPALYARVLDGFPTAWIEDPAFTAETEALLAPHRDRITWDAPIHCVADVTALAFQPKMLNVKPSRLGSIKELLDLYDHCVAHGIGTYGGGQTELGVGRGQIEYLASLFHPDAPNDVAPALYNVAPLPDRLPASPLPQSAAPIGFRWEP